MIKRCARVFDPFLPWLSSGGVLVLSFCLALPVAPGRIPECLANDPASPPASAVDAGRDLIPSVEERFGGGGEAPVPDFQRHVSPLLGRLGCNGRACHGSFQGQGGFRLSLFGYDFDADLAALRAEETGRVEVASPAESLLLAKPTDADFHSGGLRFEKGGWQYRLLEKWIAAGAEGVEQPARLERLEIVPAELVFSADGQQVQLQAIAHWENGEREDVTPLCRFQSNDPQIAVIDESGLVSSGLRGDSHVVVFYDNAVAPIPVMRRWSDGLASDSASNRESFGPVDDLVQAKLDKLGLVRSDVADDATFLRRVTLDLTGTLPSSGEVRAFLADSDPEKRARKIDALLETPAYAAWWTTFFCDMTGNNSEQLRQAFNSGAMPKVWYEWIRERVAANLPYDQIVEGIVLSSTRGAGQSYFEYCEELCGVIQSGDCTPLVDRDRMPLYWMRREVQSEDERANSFAHAFLGLQIQCAQCHKHPFDQWSQADFQGFSRFFSGVEVTRPNGQAKGDREDYMKILAELGTTPQAKNMQQVIREGLQKGKTVPLPQLVVTSPRMSRQKQRELMEETGRRVTSTAYRDGILPGRETVRFAGLKDVREPLMEWLRRPDNPYFARALVNRVWARYFGTGIVSPADDLNLANPPSNAELLDWLARNFVAKGYDLKWLHREIVSSRTYQTDWQPNATNGEDRRNFSRSLPRRLAAEAIVDATEQASASAAGNLAFAEQVEDRAISVPGTAFARDNPRNASSSGFALQIFGRSTRSSGCDCDRSEETSLIQTVWLQNDRDVHSLFARPDGWLAEVRGSLQTPAEKQAAQSLAVLRSRVERMARQQKAAAQAGNEEQARRLAQRLAPMQKELAAARAASGVPQPAAEIDATLVAGLVEEAYLRTVGRFPDESETARCIEHIREYDSVGDGLAGVLWSLINCSEFIVNH